MNGKGDKRRPMTVQRELFADNWDRAFNKSPTDMWAFPPEKKGEMLREVNYDGMWQHSCTVEMGVMWIGKNETCNYCGAWEEDDE